MKSGGKPGESPVKVRRKSGESVMKAWDGPWGPSRAQDPLPKDRLEERSYSYLRQYMASRFAAFDAG